MRSSPATASPAAVPGGDPAPLAVAQFRRWLPALWLAGVRGVAIVLQFASQVVVGLLAGASGVGILQLATSWICVVGEFLALGLPARAMRQVAVDHANDNKTAIASLLASSAHRILKLSAVLLLVFVGVLLLSRLSGLFALERHHVLMSVAVLLGAPCFALMKLYAESLKASGKVLFAVGFESLSSPVTLLLLSAICWVLGATLVAAALVAAFLLSVALAALAMRVGLSQALCRMGNESRPGREGDHHQHTDLLFLWVSSLLSIVFLNLPFLLMPLFISTADIGVFSIAHKLLNVVTTLLLLMAAVYGPKFARAYAAGDSAALASTLRQTQLISCAVFLPASGLLVLFANPLAGLFGAEFEGLQGLLLILCAGQLVNAITGLSGVLLNMTGAAARELIALAAAITFCVVGTAWLGDSQGAVGLVAVFSASIALKNVASWLLARYSLNAMGKRT